MVYLKNIKQSSTTKVIKNKDKTLKTKHRVKSIVTVNSWILLIGFLAAATITQVASADTRTFSINPYGVRLNNGATTTAGSGYAGIILPSSGNSNFSFGFVIPNDYLPNSPIRIILSWYAPATGCDFGLLTSFVDRTRPNHPHSTAEITGGFKPANNSFILTAPDTWKLGQKKVYLLTQGEHEFDQQPGDAILMGFYRSPGGLDRQYCASDLIISGITIKYQTP